MFETKVFCPNYYKKFECIGDKCKNNCCHDWAIKIDKSSYDKYMNLESELQQEFAKKIKVTQEDPFQAVFELDENGRCGFLSENGLCTIQQRLGHEVLCYTCKSYPRTLIDVAGENEAFLSMSCEAAAKAALFEKNIMKLAENTLRMPESPAYNAKLDINKYSANRNGKDYFWRLRSASIYILQSREYKLWERMVMLGLFIKSVDEILREENDRLTGVSQRLWGRGYREIFELADELMDKVDAGEFRDLLKQLPDRIDLKIGLLLSMLNEVEEYRGKSLSKYVGQVKEGLGFVTGEQDMQPLIDRFTEAYQKYYLPFFSKHAYVWENYVVNQVFMSGFPFDYKSEGSILDNYIKLAIKFSMVKFMLVGMSGYHKRGFDKKVVIEGIAAFSRIFEHNDSAIKNALAFLNEHNAGTVGAVSMFIKE